MPSSTNSKDWTNESVVAARLRMDVTMTKGLAEALTKQIAAIEGSQDTLG